MTRRTNERALFWVTASSGKTGAATVNTKVPVASGAKALQASIAKPLIENARNVGEPPKEEVKTSMEALIHHFKIVAHGFFPPVGEAYQAIEAPKGELGFYFVSDGTPRPWRMKVRSPSFVNLQSLPTMIEGRLVADVITAIGSLDIVLGEIDR